MGTVFGCGSYESVETKEEKSMDEIMNILMTRIRETAAIGLSPGSFITISVPELESPRYDEFSKDFDTKYYGRLNDLSRELNCVLWTSAGKCWIYMFDDRIGTCIKMHSMTANGNGPNKENTLYIPVSVELCLWEMRERLDSSGILLCRIHTKEHGMYVTYRPK